MVHFPYLVVSLTCLCKQVNAIRDGVHWPYVWFHNRFLHLSNSMMSNLNKYIKNLTERLVTSAKIHERMSKIIHDSEQENERLRSELRNVTRACNASKSESALSGIDDVRKKNYEQLKMEYEALNNKMRQQDEVLKDFKIYIDRIEKRAAFLEYERERLAAVVHAREIQMVNIYKTKTSFCYLLILE